MAMAQIEQFNSYLGQTVGAVALNLDHGVPAPFSGEDCWGHWTVRATARDSAGDSCKHFYQRVSGIWTPGGLLVFTGTQPAMESESAPSMTTSTLTVNTFNDNIRLVCTGIAAKTINWFATIVTHNVYAESP